MTGNKTPGMHAPSWKSFQLYQSDRVADIICERDLMQAPLGQGCKPSDAGGTTAPAARPLQR